MSARLTHQIGRQWDDSLSRPGSSIVGSLAELVGVVLIADRVADIWGALGRWWAQRRKRSRTFDAGDVIHREGDECDRVAFVTEGEIRVAKGSPAGRGIEIYRVVAIEPCVLELSAAMGRSGYPARAVATTGGRAVTVPADALVDLLATDAGVQRFVFGFMSARLASVMQLVEEVAFRKMDERLETFLRRDATGEPPVVRMTHDAIAERLGTAREVVSRLLEQMSQRGEVTLRRGEVRLTAGSRRERDPGH